MEIASALHAVANLMCHNVGRRQIANAGNLYIPKTMIYKMRMPRSAGNFFAAVCIQILAQSVAEIFGVYIAIGGEAFGIANSESLASLAVFSSYTYAASQILAEVDNVRVSASLNIYGLYGILVERLLIQFKVQ